MMKKNIKSILIGLLGISLVLGGCSLPGQSDKTTNKGNSQTTYSQDITEKTGKNIIYYTSDCDLGICQKSNLSKTIKQFGLTKADVQYVDLKGYDQKISRLEEKGLNRTPLIKFTKKFANQIVSQNPQMGSYLKSIDGKKYLPMSQWQIGVENKCNDGKDNDGNGKTDLADKNCKKVSILTDSRCKESICNPQRMKKQLTSQMFPLGYTFQKTKDYAKTGDKLYDKLLSQIDSNSLKLPVVLAQDVDEQVKKGMESQGMLKKIDHNGYKYLLTLGQKWEPTDEICDNGKDDNGNGKIDCEDPTCSDDLKCNKVVKPSVELFVMSHCPYGTQMEKAVLPVYDLLKDKINFDIKFVDYAMHKEKEVNEQVRQYCIKKNYGIEKLTKYLKCFLGSSSGSAKDSKSCMKKQNVKVDKCVTNTNQKYDIQKLLKDKSKWEGRFPPFPIYKDENEKYDVSGSPTFVLNGQKVDRAPRNSQAILDLVCKTFKKDSRPAECDQDLSSQGFGPGFGYDKSNGQSNNASCGN